jgi:prepilin-type N-terminal cleavage/methylation domain-containing protein
MKKQNAQSGFTLIEMLVSIAIFMVVAVIAVTALLKIVDASKKSQTLQDTVNNVNFAMDSITRELRVGSMYTCYSSGAYTGSLHYAVQGAVCAPNPITNVPAGVSIAFLSSNIDPHYSTPCNLTYSYYFAPHPDGISKHWTIEKAQESSCNGGVSTYAPIIDPLIIITTYIIRVNVAAKTQPSVFLYISGYTGNTDKTKTYFDLQTTVSERT